MKPTTPEVCKTEGCNRSVRSKGLCSPCQAHAWRAANLDRARRKVREYHLEHPERHSASTHHQAIFKEYGNKKLACYNGMPFFDSWNPDKGGSFLAAEVWIRANIGSKPDKDHQLHIVDTSLGFVPGNLQWIPRHKHKQTETINRLLLENQNLRIELAKLKASL